MHERGLQAVHKVHALGNITSPSPSQLERDIRSAFFLLMKYFEESSSMAKLCDNDWMSLVSRRTHKEHKVWMTYLR